MPCHKALYFASFFCFLGIFSFFLLTFPFELNINLRAKYLPCPFFARDHAFKLFYFNSKALDCFPKEKNLVQSTSMLTDALYLMSDAPSGQKGEG